MTYFHRVELLAPAGGWPQLRAALDAGADAVFFGAGRLNMRARAKNFSLGELSEVCDLCHANGTGAYLTLNTLMYESDLPELKEILKAAKEAGVDAVIAADFAVLQAASDVEMPVHISTQMSVSNSAALRILMEMGARRVVMARECSLEDLLRIRQELGAAADGLVIEVFAHGAMCVAESGRCFLSGFESGRSANRGECAQPCRRDYRILSDRGGEGFRLEGGHVLSPKDLCTLPFLEQLVEAGVGALKIEGRNRSPDYVHTVVSVYREALDVLRAGEPATRLSEVKERGMARLEQVYHRGFSEGFYLGKPMGDWTTPPGNQSSRKREYIGRILSIRPDRNEAVLRLESSSLSCDETLFSESPETGYREWRAGQILLDGGKVKNAGKGQEVLLPRLDFMHTGLKVYRHALRSE